MTLSRLIMASHTYFTLSSRPLTRRLPALIQPRIPSPPFNHPACFGVRAYKPLRSPPWSTTLLLSSMLPALRNDKGLAVGIYNRSHSDPLFSMSSSAVRPSIDIRAQMQSRSCSSAALRYGLAANVYSTASRRGSALWGSRWSLQPAAER